MENYLKHDRVYNLSVPGNNLMRCKHCLQRRERPSDYRTSRNPRSLLMAGRDDTADRERSVALLRHLMTHRIGTHVARGRLGTVVRCDRPGVSDVFGHSKRRQAALNAPLR